MQLPGTFNLIDVLRLMPGYLDELVQPFVDLVLACPPSLVGTDRNITAATVFQHFSQDELNTLPSYFSFALLESRLKVIADSKSLKSKSKPLKSKAKSESEAQLRENIESIFASLKECIGMKSRSEQYKYVKKCLGLEHRNSLMCEPVFRQFMNGTHASAKGLHPAHTAALSEFVRLKKQHNAGSLCK